jgi:hypothetical protein
VFDVIGKVTHTNTHTHTHADIYIRFLSVCFLLVVKLLHVLVYCSKQRNFNMCCKFNTKVVYDTVNTMLPLYIQYLGLRRTEKQVSDGELHALYS